MRLIKYFFLLSLLAFIGFSVHILTQKSDFEVEVTEVIKTNRASVFEFVNDYKNWESFGSWMTKNSEIKFNYEKNSIGLGASCTFDNGSDEGSIKTCWLKENDSLSQKINFNNSSGTISWKLKDTLGGTKVTIYTKGRLDTFSKISSFFDGGVNQLLTAVYKKSLQNLDKTLQYEMNSFSIKVNGVAHIKAGFCLKKTVTCRITSISKNTKILLAEMVLFFNKNKIPRAGKPFISYDRYDITNNSATISIGIPVKKQISISDGSDITSAEIIPFTCLKTTLIGDYSHTKTAWKKAEEYLKTNKLRENSAGNYTHLFIKTIDDIKRPSKWITEIYIPILPKNQEKEKKGKKEKEETEETDEVKKPTELLDDNR